MSKRDRVDAQIMQNAIKTLLININFSSIDGPTKSIVLTSTIPNEGKSTIAVGLAQSIASSGKSVLLVECDMRRRSLANILGVHASSGIYAVLSGQVQLNDAAIATPVPGLYFLDSEPHIPNPVDIIGSKRFSKLVSTAETIYDYVVIDTPPVGTFVDAAMASHAVDGTVLVVREKFTRRQDAANAVEQLKKAGASILGVVMNYCENERSDHYYEYYNKPVGRNNVSAAAVSAGAQRGGQAGVPTGTPLPVRRGTQVSAQTPVQAPTQGAQLTESRFRR